MEKYIRYFEKENNLLKLYVKIPFGKDFRQVRAYFKNKYDSELMDFLDVGIDETGKYCILYFVLRNEKDIKPYIEECNRLTKEFNKLKEMINK